jgi:hypothetical protein
MDQGQTNEKGAIRRPARSYSDILKRLQDNEATVPLPAKRFNEDVIDTITRHG